MAFDAAMNAGVLEKDLLNQVSEQLASLKPMAAVFEQNYVKRLHGDNVKTGSKMELAEQLIEDALALLVDDATLIAPAGPAFSISHRQSFQPVDGAHMLPTKCTSWIGLTADEVSGSCTERGTEPRAPRW